VSNAEPGPITGRLMNEPLSMLDYGLWRTELELKHFFIDSNKVFVGTRYNWAKDQISIQVILYEAPESLKHLDAEKQCIQVINSIKDFYGIELSTGRPTASMGSTLLGQSFIHNGYAGSDIPQDELFKQLDKMTHIYVTMVQQKSKKRPGKINTDVKNVSCDAALLGKTK